MGLEGLPYQLLQVPLSSGLNTKGDQRAQDPPALEICQNVEFDDIGGLRLRKPFTAIGNAIVGGGTLANARKVVANGAELLCFTSDTLYSWDAAAAAWAAKGTHLAVKVDEQSRFVTTDDQIDPDRAELGGVVVYCWTNGTDTFVAAIDKATGEARVAPTKVTGGTQPRLVACTTRILLFYVAGGSLKVVAIDPANITIGAGATVDVAGAFGGSYDVARVPGSDSVAFVYRVSGNATYTVGTLTASLVQAQLQKARAADGPVAISVIPGGTGVHVIRTVTTSVLGDFMGLPAFNDGALAAAIGTTTSGGTNQLTAAHRSVQDGGFYRCYVFWTAGENTNNTAAWAIKTNWVTSAGATGAAANFAPWVGIASRAFDYNGSVYLWTAFGQTSGLGAGSANVSSTGQFQNAYYLRRDDGFIAAKSTYNRGGGLAPTNGRLPTVQSLGGTAYAWCATERRIIPVGVGSATTGATRPSSSYAMRAPRDVLFSFDDNGARRVARLGRALYIATGEGVMQYDGAQIAEAGYPVYPWYFDAVVAGPGNIPTGTYGYKSTFRWYNAQGEVDRSTTATVANAAMPAATTSGFAIATVPLPITHKTGSAPAVEVWRTVVNPTADAPFYLVTALNPASTSNPNRYLASDATLAGFNPTLNDVEADAVATVNQTNPENGAVLANLAPPAASIIAASADRLFIAGIAGDQDRVWYSKQRNDGEVVAFNDGLTVSIPQAGGSITAIAFDNEIPVVFRQRAVYALLGDGNDNVGGGANYATRLISSDVGCVSAEAVGYGPFGLLFKSNKGWYRLGRDVQSVEYVGAAVAKFDSDTVLAVQVIESQHQVRCLTNARMLVFDYLVNEWSEWTISTGLSACLWNGNYVALCPSVGAVAANAGATALGHAIGSANDGPITQAADYASGVSYAMDVETAWIKLAGLQGRGYVRTVQVIGEYRSAHRLRWRLSRDYIGDGAGGWSYYDDVTAPASTPTVVGGQLQLRHGPSRKPCQAIKIRLTGVAADGVSLPTGEAFKLTGIALDAAGESGFQVLPSGQRA